MREQQVLGWTLNETQGEYESLCVIPKNNNDEVWAVVKRKNGKFIERFVPRTFLEGVMDGVYVDCASIITKDTKFKLISGLERFEGQEVSVLADGNVERHTVLNGQITLNNECNKAIVGLGYTSTIETLSFNSMETNISSKKAKIFTIIVDFYRSRGGQIGTQDDKLDLITQRSDEPIGDPTRLQSKPYKMSPQSTNSEEKSVIIVQKDPLPITVLGITADIKVGEI
jgi:hypothetical protein